MHFISPKRASMRTVVKMVHIGLLLLTGWSFKSFLIIYVNSDNCLWRIFGLNNFYTFIIDNINNICFVIDVIDKPTISTKCSTVSKPTRGPNLRSFPLTRCARGWCEKCLHYRLYFLILQYLPNQNRHYFWRTNPCFYNFFIHLNL